MDKISPQRRSANMRAIRSKGTKPEILVRRLAHSLGFRYRLHRKDLPGKPDLAFISRRKAIFVHGCFWHQHAGCPEGKIPASNVAYWGPKLARNGERDRKNESVLCEAGWNVLTIWECETAETDELAVRVQLFLEG